MIAIEPLRRHAPRRDLRRRRDHRRRRGGRPSGRDAPRYRPLADRPRRRAARRPSRRPASSLATRGRRSRRSTASRRHARRRSTRSGRAVAPLSFGTDGVRGRATTSSRRSYALRFGRAVVTVLGATALLVGRDTRRSGAMLASAVCAGAASEGADVSTSACCRRRRRGALRARTPCRRRGLRVAQPLRRQRPQGLRGRRDEARGGRGGGDRGRAAAIARRPIGATDRSRRRDRSGSTTTRAPRTWRLLLAAADASRLDGLRIVVDCANGAASGSHRRSSRSSARR